MITHGKAKTSSTADAPGLSREDIESIIRSSVEQTAAAVRSELTHLLNAKLDAIYKELKGGNDIILELGKENKELRICVNNLQQRQDAADIYSRKANILIQGLSATYSQSLSVQSGGDAFVKDIIPVEISAISETMFVEFCQKLRINVKPMDIAACHRFPRFGEARYPPHLVKFTNWKIRFTLREPENSSWRPKALCSSTST